MAYGELGPTHHSIEDLSWLRAIADLAIVVPADPAQTRAAVRWAAKADRPPYLRIGRFKVPAVAKDEDGFRLWPRRRAATRWGVTIVATGIMSPRAGGGRRSGGRGFRARAQRVDHQAARRKRHSCRPRDTRGSSPSKKAWSRAVSERRSPNSSSAMRRVECECSA